MIRSKIVKDLADMASQGRYSVDPQGARNMNALFERVALLINILEAEELAKETEEVDVEEAAAAAIERIFEGETSE